VNVIVATGGTVSAVAAKPVVPETIPMVFAMGGDPVKLGIVASLARPGGNITGVSFLINGLAAKEIELLHELVPKAAVIAFLVNPNDPNTESDTREAQAAADAFGQKLVVVKASTESELDAALTTFAQQRVAALFGSLRSLFHRPAQGSSLLQLATRCPRFRNCESSPQLVPWRPMEPALPTPIVNLASIPAGSQGHQTRRSASAAAHEIRAGHQPQDRQGARPHDPTIAAVACRRGDSMIEAATWPPQMPGATKATSGNPWSRGGRATATPAAYACEANRFVRTPAASGIPRTYRC
jgi:hypothetical protein